MFKPVTAKPVTTPVTQLSTQSDTKHVTVPTIGTESVNVSTKDPRDLFKGVSEETLALLDLELRTMNYEWLKVLAPELTKPYFLKVNLCQ